MDLSRFSKDSNGIQGIPEDFSIDFNGFEWIPHDSIEFQ